MASHIKKVRFDEKIKMMKWLYFCIFMSLYWFLKLLGFLWRSLPSHAAMPKLLIWSASKAWQVLATKTPNVYKLTAWNHHCPLWHEHHHWGFGMPGYTFGSGIWARAIPQLPEAQLTQEPIEFPMGVPISNSITGCLVHYLLSHFQIRQKGVKFEEI